MRTPYSRGTEVSESGASAQEIGHLPFSRLAMLPGDEVSHSYSFKGVALFLMGQGGEFHSMFPRIWLDILFSQDASKNTF